MKNNSTKTKMQILALFLALAFTLQISAQQQMPLSSNDLQTLSDEFNGENSLAGWKQFSEAEGWMPMTKIVDVNKTSPGNLYLEPGTSGWYEDFHGVFLFKEVTGNFLATTRLKVSGKNGELPTALWSLAGLMAREPRAMKKENWQPKNENWLFFTVGVAEPAGQLLFETKSTVNSRSNLKLRPAKTGWVELAIARVRSAFILLYRYDGETKWQIQERFHRRDLGRTLQVGVNAYSDWYGAREFHNDPFKFNTIAAKNSKADLVLNVDYVRFRPISYNGSPRSDAGELTDYSMSNDELLKALGL
jgi:hypothetical protein